MCSSDLGIEAEVLTDYQEFTDYGYGANWLFHGYRIRMNMNGLKVEGFLPSPDLPIVWLAPGQKVIVM